MQTYIIYNFTVASLLLDALVVEEIGITEVVPGISYWISCEVQN